MSDVSFPVAESGPPTQPPGSVGRWRTRLARMAILLVSLFLFIVALELMKSGARALEPLVRDFLRVDGLINAVGMGWLFAYFVLSGSPVAAAGLTLLDQGVLDPLETFGMINGSRMGASFIVLAMGFLYALRGHERSASVSVGVLSFAVTITTQTVALVLGAAIITYRLIPLTEVSAAGTVSSIADLLTGPTVHLLRATALGVGGSPAVFALGVLVILLSFGLFDRGLPPLSLRDTPVGGTGRLVYRPMAMFGLGAAVTLVSMSVSMSLSILVPLSSRGYVRRENLIPYIMGANITTFVDTLIASMLLRSPWAFNLVLTEMLAVTVVSLIVLVFAMDRYERAMMRAVRWTTARQRNLILFLVLLCVVPVLLLFVR